MFLAVGVSVVGRCWCGRCGCGCIAGEAMQGQYDIQSAKKAKRRNRRESRRRPAKSQPRVRGFEMTWTFCLLRSPRNELRLEYEDELRSLAGKKDRNDKNLARIVTIQPCER